MNETSLEIEEDTYNNIDWSLRVTATDNYTSPDDIILTEVYDNVMYYTPGTYLVKIEAIDLVGNKKINFLYITVIEVSGC